MKKTICILTAICFFTLIACRKEDAKPAAIVRDCTGTYLRLDGKDYHVCNLEMTSSFPDGASVKATFKEIKECNGSANNAIVCFMLHKNEGWIEIEKIK